MGRKKTLILIISLICFIQTSGQEPQFEIKTAGKSLAVEKFSKYYYSSFDLEKPSMLTLLSDIPISSIEISPLNDHIPFNQADNKTLTFTLSEPGQYLIRINDSVKIFLFANMPLKTSDEQFVNIVTRYNVDPTGKNNETVKIQQALNEISGSGKILYFPPGSVILLDWRLCYLRDLI